MQANWEKTEIALCTKYTNSGCQAASSSISDSVAITYSTSKTHAYHNSEEYFMSYISSTVVNNSRIQTHNVHILLKKTHNIHSKPRAHQSLTLFLLLHISFSPASHTTIHREKPLSTNSLNRLKSTRTDHTISRRVQP